MALHLAISLGGAEFYPTCSQLTVGASGTGVPDPSGLVNLPGAYSDNDPGIFYSQMFDASAPKDTFPGPPVAAFVNGGTSTPGNATTTVSSTATATQTSGAAGTSTTSKGKMCTLKKGKSASSLVVPSASAAAASATTTDMYPRHFSRLALGHSI
ncbi:glycoside hydrolase family 61 protein [Laccaria bicolor S238N-H82]|uniref:lytic cellulose monooxygenase (C4-dehydrogenating) n=1 Tax=Laccaria bicolor (strain S238N-H82 / ATCC MYA-4686) TaxID=486041 RepID=B0DIW0_LACBS|nr:glycoside hydrolase family 61 protein [Laccaria bicolor S238N-H82]EDR05413.1 glycoside hydrolase family 61 protein [Laccaria bicolor S238N-H82]|eukprot:XP_001883971.1 glycoside hydrolase family 61 protein [Laccaria bicolor S238N-H82]